MFMAENIEIFPPKIDKAEKKLVGKVGKENWVIKTVI